MKFLKLSLVNALILPIAFLSHAQPGAIDTTFNPTDQGYGCGDGASSIVYTTTIQLDGKIIIGGNFTSCNGTAINRIARLNTNGSIDTSFNPGEGANMNVLTTALQNDGKIIIGGGFTNYIGTGINYISRLNANGSLDTLFNPGIGTNGWVYTTALQSDGKIIVGGDFTSYNGTSRKCIARLNADGSLDASFSPGTGANDDIRAVALQSDGKILIVGKFTSYNGMSRNYITRLNADGSLDTSFITGTGANDDIRTISIQSDGKIIIGGYFTSYNGTTRIRIARLNTNGSLDTSFDPGSCTSSFVVTTAIQSDGKIIIGGFFASYNGIAINNIARINNDGSLDTLFNPGTGTSSYVLTTAIQSDGKIIIGGAFSNYNGIGLNNIARLNVDGSLDTFFNQGTGASSFVHTTVTQADGKIIIGGGFLSYNGTGKKRIARINEDGSLDTSFNMGSGASSTIWTSAIQNDGKIIIGGYFTVFNGTAINRIARLNSDGSLDNTFNPGTGANSTVWTIAIQSNGKIIIGGDFTIYNGTTISRIARLNANGSLDSTFNPGTGANNLIRTTTIQSDGKIIIGGWFTNYDTTSRNYIARLNADGSLDTSFNIGTGVNNNVLTSAIQSDGKIIIGGEFISYNGTIINHIARLNDNGSLDSTINLGIGTDYPVSTMVMQSDGKIVIGGGFTTYNGTAINRLARLNADFSLDITFSTGTGPGGSVYTTAIQSDGKIIIGGFFTSYNGTGRNRVARILAFYSESTSICDGDTCTWHGSNYTNAGVYYDSLTTVTGLDSIYQLTLTINPVYSFTENHSICNGESYTWRGTSYSVSGIYYDSLLSVTGCDSIFQLSLNVNPIYTVAENHSICNGETYYWHGTNYTIAGVYYDSLNTFAGCDSIFQMNLSINLIDTSLTIVGTTISANLIADAYQWVDCDNAYTSIIGATSQSYAATTIGNYAVIITSGSCSDTSACYQIGSIGMASNQMSDGISVYPIPFSNQLNIEMEENGHKVKFEILNLMGQAVLNGDFNERKTILTSQLPAGVYFIKLQQGESFEFKKVIKGVSTW